LGWKINFRLESGNEIVWDKVSLCKEHTATNKNNIETIMLTRIKSQWSMEVWVIPWVRRHWWSLSNQLFPAWHNPYMFFLT
jgi:hypothetical protein